jgi:hypothetical protein
MRSLHKLFFASGVSTGGFFSRQDVLTWRVFLFFTQVFHAKARSFRKGAKVFTQRREVFTQGREGYSVIITTPPPL